MVIDTYINGPDKPTIRKDPNALLDYSFDWTDYLAPINDTIASASFVLDASLVNTFFANTAQTAIVWITGGIVGETPRVTCRITTTGGRTDDRSIFLKIVER